jgi:hypothetical protein
MATVALTNLKIGKEDGSFTWIEEGEDVKKSDLPEGVFDELKEAGAIGAPPAPRESDASAAELEAENDDLKKRVEELEAQLAAAKKDTGSTGTGGAKTTTTK